MDGLGHSRKGRLAALAGLALAMACGAARADRVELFREEGPRKGAICVVWPCERAAPSLLTGGNDAAEVEKGYERRGRPRPISDTGLQNRDRGLGLKRGHDKNGEKHGTHGGEGGREAARPKAMVRGEAFDWFILDPLNRPDDRREDKAADSPTLDAVAVNDVISGAGGIQPEAVTGAAPDDTAVLASAMRAPSAGGPTADAASPATATDDALGSVVLADSGTAASRAAAFDKPPSETFLKPAAEAQRADGGSPGGGATLIPVPGSAWVGLSGLAFAAAWKLGRRRMAG
ncbi:MAG: hypothetical protein WD749_11285 [Phycisphaerales bacterium]